MIKRNITLIALTLPLIGLLSLTACQASENSAKADKDVLKVSQANVLDYVDPFIGTGGHGHTFPGAVVPFGMVQLSPDNPSKGWDWTSGYHYSDNQLLGFSHTHLSGTGVGDLLDILVMPFRGDYVSRKQNDLGRPVTTYSHDDETASAGYYSLTLPQEKVAVELTATERTGVHRYTFEGGEPAQLLFDLGYAQNYDKAVATFMRVIDDKTLVGYRISTGWTDYQPVHFVAKFNRPFSHQFYVKGEPSFDNKPLEGNVVNRPETEVVLNFGDLTDKPLVAKVALSYVSIDGAQKNLASEVQGFDFDAVKAEARELWAKQLIKFKVTDSDQAAKTKFYTALYHSFLAPQIFHDVDGSFFGADGAAHKGADFKRYTLFSLWDTFRALQPLLTITDSDRINDMVKSMLAFYDETGLLPTWDLMSNETDVMIGYHAVPVLVDAYLKGLTDADPEKLFEAIKASAMQNQFGVDQFREYGFVPSDLELEAVSKTLEYAYDDWAIAQMAKALGKREDSDYFSQRANAYKTLFDKQSGFMRGKNSDGKWVKNFNPIYVNHRVTDYTEANAWQYTWFVPHDVPGLIDLFGGQAPFLQKLDTLFTTSSKMEGEDVSADISGLIGQYVHGNEPCHHIPYMYAYTDQMWKGEQRIKEIRDTMYLSGPDGLSGNDDVGQMSAWYVFSALGFYPMNPASGEYVLGTPEFDKVEISLPNNKSITINGHNKENAKYIGEIVLNGKTMPKRFLDHSALMEGGVLDFHFEKNGPQN